MTWGISLMYYHCPQCGLKFKYPLDLISSFGDDFGLCPRCRLQGIYEYDGPRRIDDLDYIEIEDYALLSKMRGC